MGYGYDFTQDDNENGFDFTTDDTELIAQEEAARQSELWENLSESAIAGEINALNSRISEAYKEIKKAGRENNYEKTAELMKALWTKDLSSEGWISKFCSANADAFPLAAGASEPSWVSSLSPEKLKTYKAVRDYYRDASALLDICAHVSEMLRALPLKNGYKITMNAVNFADACIDEARYDAINSFVKGVSDQIGQDWAAMERNAERADMYYEANHAKLSRDEFLRGYRQERVKDYLDNLKKNRAVYDNLIDRGNGVFALHPQTYAIMCVIDKYTIAIAQSVDLTDIMGKVLEQCKSILTADIPAAEKVCTTQACSFLLAAFQTLVEESATFAEYCGETYRLYKEGKGGVYSFMKKLPALSSVNTRYGFTPDTSDPWENGTYYEEMYQKAVNAIVEHCSDFVYNHGRSV